MRKWKSSKFYLNIKWVHLDIIYKFQIVSFLLLCITEMHFLFRIGVSVKQQFTEEEIYKDRDSQISAIEKTFEDAQKSVSMPLTWLMKSVLDLSR